MKSWIVVVQIAVFSIAHIGWAGPRVCAQNPVQSGVDVSRHQQNTQWSQVAASGKSFTFVKATEGQTYKNPSFDTDWAAAKEAGLIRGAYHYFNPADDPVVQADFFITQIGNGKDRELPPILDWEETKNVPIDKIIARGKIFLDRVEAATGMVPIIYTGPSYWNHLGNPVGFDRYPLFIAEYNVTCPEVPAPWKNWSFWQHSVGQALGVNGPSDLDFFNGLLVDLEALISGDQIAQL